MHSQQASDSDFCSEDLEVLSFGADVEVYIEYETFKYIFIQKELNMRKHRQLELMPDYHHDIYYHLETANVAPDTLSMK